MLHYTAVYEGPVGRSRPLTIFVEKTRSADALRWDQGEQVWQYAPELVKRFAADEENWERIDPVDRAAAEEYARGLSVDGSGASELPSEEWIEWFFSWKGDPPEHEDVSWEDEHHARGGRS